ncbi:AMP-binding protein [Paenarthrobacter nitroguajacolicus]
MLPRQAQTCPSKVALVTDEQRLTFAEFDEASNSVVAGLSSRGSRAGGHVAILARMAGNGSSFTTRF